MSQKPGQEHLNNGFNFTPTIHSDTYDFINPEQHNLSGRAVFITGASKGCGKEAALSYARAGASYIAIAARTLTKEVEIEIFTAAAKAERASPRILCLEVDVVDQDSVQAAADSIRQNFGKLDILVNNAGILENSANLTETQPSEWWQSFEVNLKGPYLVSRALLPLMLESTDGLKTVVNISSLGAHLLAPGPSAYRISKLAILRLGEFVDAEYAEQGIICISVHPGSVMTQLSKGLPEALHRHLSDQPRLSANTIVWLTAGRKSWLSGRYVSSTWDMSELLQRRIRIEEEDLLKVRMDVGSDW